MLDELLKLNGLKSDEKPKEAPQEKLIEDEKGNKYKQVIEDGVITLKLIEDSKGILYE